MQIIRKIIEKRENPMGAKVPTIAFFGDSVTQGCFELYMKGEKLLGNICEEEKAYPTYVRKILSLFFPDVPVNIVRAGLAGDNAAGGLERLERDVLSYLPDIVVVCFGLNDSNFGLDTLPRYLNSLKEIFEKIQASGAEVIFMTPNMMNTYVSNRVEPPMAKGNAESTCKIQNEGVYDSFLEGAKNLCKEQNIPVCNCYEKWKMLYENGVDVTELLSNKINHPVREMHWLFAGMLVNAMFEN